MTAVLEKRPRWPKKKNGDAAEHSSPTREDRTVQVTARDRTVQVTARGTRTVQVIAKRRITSTVQVTARDRTVQVTARGTNRAGNCKRHEPCR
jgi:hypothetical protein